MGSWDPTLYGNDEALDARGDVLAAIALPEEPLMFAACVGLLALLDPTADQLERVPEHPTLRTLAEGLREPTLVAAKVGASGPSLPYGEPVASLLGVTSSYGRMIDPLLALREAIIMARVIRDRCIRAVDEGFAYGETAIGGVIGVLLELRELGVATSPDLVDEWATSFDRLCEEAADADADAESQHLREWTAALRAALRLLAQQPARKLLGSDPSEPRRSRS